MLPEGRGAHVRAISPFVPVQRLNEVLLEPADCSLGDDPAGVIVYSEEERVCFALVVHGLLRVYMQASDGREVASLEHSAWLKRMRRRDWQKSVPSHE